MIDWDRALDREVRRVAGPFDESDEVNHDPDSLVGEEDEDGYDDQAWFVGWLDYQTIDDDGFDDAGDDDDEGEDDEDEE